MVLHGMPAHDDPCQNQHGNSRRITPTYRQVGRNEEKGPNFGLSSNLPAETTQEISDKGQTTSPKNRVAEVCVQRYPKAGFGREIRTGEVAYVPPPMGLLEISAGTYGIDIK